MNRFDIVVETKPSFSSGRELQDWISNELSGHLSFYRDKFMMFFLSTKEYKITGGKTFKSLEDYTEYFKKMPASTLFVGILEAKSGPCVWGMNCLDFTVKVELDGSKNGKIIYFRNKNKTVPSLSVEEGLKVIEDQFQVKRKCA